MATKTNNKKNDNSYINMAVEEYKKTGKVRNPRIINMSVDDIDDDKAKRKAELFNKLWRIESKRGIAKFDNVEDMKLIIEDYFSDCAEEGIRPTVLGLANALGTTWKSLYEWEQGCRDKTLGSSCSDTIKKAKAFIAQYDELMALEGIDNPVLYMFRSKNFYELADKQEIVVAPKEQLEAKSMEELAREIPEIPIEEEE